MFWLIIVYLFIGFIIALAYCKGGVDVELHPDPGHVPVTPGPRLWVRLVTVMVLWPGYLLMKAGEAAVNWVLDWDDDDWHSHGD